MMSADTHTPQELVAALADDADRFPAYCALGVHGRAALPAIRAGLGHDSWQVRKWCAMFLDAHADPESLADLVPLLNDPKSDVRLWAVHSISCEHCKDERCQVDVVPLLLERITRDESIRVRRMAAAMLATLPPDHRVTPVVERIRRSATDRKLRLHAARCLEHHRHADSGG